MFGLVLLGLSLAGGAERTVPPEAGALGMWLAASAVLALLAALGGSRLGAGAGLGVAAGTLYATGDVATKAAVLGGGRLSLVRSSCSPTVPPSSRCRSAFSAAGRSPPPERQPCSRTRSRSPPG